MIIQPEIEIFPVKNVKFRRLFKEIDEVFKFTVADRSRLLSWLCNLPQTAQSKYNKPKGL